jgi:hypothetical protein
MDASRLRFVTTAPEQATGVRQILGEAMASQGCESEPKHLAAVSLRVPPAMVGFW